MVNLNKLMKEAQKAQQKLMKVQEEAASMTAEAQSGGGVVSVVANGDGKILAITLDKEVVSPDDIEMLQDLVVAASNAAITKAKEAVDTKVQKEMKNMTGGMGNVGNMLSGMGFN